MRKLLPLLIIILSACNPLVTDTPRPSPQVIKVAYTSTLQPWVEILSQCANDNPEVALIVEETSLSDLQSQDADITLWFGEPLQGSSDYAISLGSDEIIVVAGEKKASPREKTTSSQSHNTLALPFSNKTISGTLVLFSKDSPVYKVNLLNSKSSAGVS